MKTLLFKKYAAIFGAGIALVILTGCPSGDSTKKAIGTVTKKTVETAKGVMSGIADGIDEGRKGTAGVDGAIVVTTFAEMQGKVRCEILGVEDDAENGVVTISLGFVNETDTPIRVSGLSDASQVMLLDKTGYVNRVRRAPMDVTIPAKAKEKAELSFNGKAASFVTLRILGGEIKLSGAK